jgi:processing peptidase subunit alpha
MHWLRFLHYWVGAAHFLLEVFQISEINCVGPGKGMYTRLYTEVLNKYHWIESANKIHHSYCDTGLFGISASVPPIKDAHDAVMSIICDQLIQATNRIPQADLDRAKNQLKSSIMMGLESKLVLLEDIGKQVLMKGSVLDPSEIVKRIDSIRGEDVMRAGRRVIFGSEEESPLDFEGCEPRWKRTGNGEPSVVVRGKLFGGDKDPLNKIGKVMEQWGVGKKQKRSFFG